jgi:hypothetical protein
MRGVVVCCSYPLQLAAEPTPSASAQSHPDATTAAVASAPSHHHTHTIRSRTKPLTHLSALHRSSYVSRSCPRHCAENHVRSFY